MRLKEAVRQAGGPLAVAHASGIPKGTIFSYQRGRDMRAEGMVALARATGVRLEWLATGDGPMRAAPGMQEDVAAFRATPHPLDAIDHANLAAALDAAETEAGRDAPADRRVAMMLRLAAELRRLVRMAPLRSFEAPALAACLQAAETILAGRGGTAETEARVALALTLYAAAEQRPAPPTKSSSAPDL